MEKSIELFAERGFNATSIQEITDHCGISKGAFYLSFKSKDALILSLFESFMKELTSGFDQVVRESDKKDLPYNYYYFSFENLSNKSDFAKILLNEQTHFLDNEFISKIQGYTELIQQSIRMMLEKTYGERIKNIKYDMVYSVQGLTKAYTELFLFSNVKLDVEHLAKSLTEKTNLLAFHTKIPYITEDLHRFMDLPQQERFSKDHLIDSLDEAIDSIESSIERESLELLKEELIHPSMSQAVIQGLIENIKHHPNCKWVAFALRHYFQKGIESN